MTDTFAPHDLMGSLIILTACYQEAVLAVRGARFSHC